MGHSNLQSQSLTIPPYLLSFPIVVLTSLLSDRFSTRSTPLAIHALLASLAYVALAIFHSPTIRYIALFPACFGFFSSVTLIITWTLNNQPSEGRRGAGLALLNVVGQCGPLVGTRLYPDEEGPYYVKGMAVCAVCMLCVASLAAGLSFVLARENRRILAETLKEREGEEGLIEGKQGGGRFLYLL